MLNQKSNLKNQNHNSKVKNEFRERCYNYSITVIKLINDLPEKRVYWTISDQLLRSATSIGANIVEAKSEQTLLKLNLPVLKKIISSIMK
jgi:four helix bundle protein